MCHSSQRPDSKNTFSPNSSNQNDFINEIGVSTILLLYLWAKYEGIWTNFTAESVILGANLLLKAQTIPQNAKCSLFFFSPKVLFNEDILILNMAKDFEICFFCNIEIC